MTNTVWLLWQDTGDATSPRTVTDVYPDQDAALRDVGARMLSGEVFATPRLAQADFHAGGTLGDGGAGAAHDIVSAVITTWRGMTTTGRARVAQRAQGLAEALDALCFPMVITRATGSED